ncbi:Uncharacterised protein [uncultured archaeon]|nr:Uncharacterised protein [uncultured archaeon]
MYHVAKVLEVMSPEEKGSKFSSASTHALVEMWDENMIIFSVSPEIAKAVKPNDIVIVDYSPVAVGGAPVPKHEVSAILSEAKGKKLWQKMKDYLGQKRKPGSAEEAFARENHPGKMVG